MLGHGFYNKHSHEQGKANTYGLPLLVEAVNGIDLGQIGDEFRIADFGSAQGQNSLLPIKTATAQIKARTAASGRTAIPISVTHTDLPTNDWTTLFQTVFFSPESYLAGVRDVFCFASGTSIYRQIFPAKPHRARLFRNHDALAQPQAVQYPERNLVRARDWKRSRYLGKTGESRLERVFAISRT